MSTKMRRLTVSLPEDIAYNVDSLKRRKFLNSPQSKAIWYLLRLGIDADKKAETGEKDQAS